MCCALHTCFHASFHTSFRAKFIRQVDKCGVPFAGMKSLRTASSEWRSQTSRSPGCRTPSSVWTWKSGCAASCMEMVCASAIATSSSWVTPTRSSKTTAAGCIATAAGRRMGLPLLLRSEKLLVCRLPCKYFEQLGVSSCVHG